MAKTTETIKNPAPAPFAMTTVHTDSGNLTTPCEPVNEWLAITPEIGMEEDGTSRLIGAFVVTHRPTGTVLTEGGGCIECARLAGRELAALDVDWSTLTSDYAEAWFAELPQDVKYRFWEVRPVEWACDAEPCEHEDSEPESGS